MTCQTHKPRVLSWLTPFSMLFARRLRDAIAFRASSFAIPLEAAQGLAWEHCLSPKCVKNIQTVSWRLSPSFHLQRCLILLWSFTMQKNKTKKKTNSFGALQCGFVLPSACGERWRMYVARQWGFILSLIIEMFLFFEKSCPHGLEDRRPQTKSPRVLVEGRRSKTKKKIQKFQRLDLDLPCRLRKMQVF